MPVKGNGRRSSLRRLAPLIIMASAASLAAGAAGVASATPNALRVGAEKIDITPTDLAGLNPMGGGAFKSVHDPIFARVLYLKADGGDAAFVTLDAIEVGDMTPLRQRIQREVGIASDRIMISATHDHNAPRIGDVSPGALAHPGGPESKIFTQAVYDKIVGALAHAKASAQPATFGLGTGTADVNVNRDLFTLDQGWHMGFNPDGPSDKTVWVLKFSDPSGKPLAVLFNYAVHDDVALGTDVVTGDLSGAAEKYVEDQVGGGAVALWTLGPAGDQDPRIFPKPEGGPGGPGGPGPRPPSNDPKAFGTGMSPKLSSVKFQALEAQGVMVGAEVVRVAGLIGNMTGDVRIAAAAREVQCPTKEGVNQLSDMTTVHVPNVTLRLGLIMLNDVALTGVGGEVVTNIYTHLRAASPLTNTIMVTIANDRIGYIADDAAYDRPIFEVNGSPMARGCAENAIVDNLTSMIRALHR